MKTLNYILPMALVIGACGQVSDSGTPFSSRDSEWETAMNAGDADGIAALYAEDARIMPPNGKALYGRDAVKEMFGAMIEAGLSVDLNAIETQSAGDIAYNVGTYELTTGGEVVDQGKSTAPWPRGAAGAWLMTNDIWNSDMAAAGAGGGGGAEKPHLMVFHEVEDFDKWIAAWRGDDSRHAMFKAHGVAHAHTFQSADNPNLTGIVMAISDMEAFNAFMDSDEVAEAAAADGVDLEATTFLNEVR